ncbi:hypothetical protein M2246_001885 [Bacillus sp. LEw-kw-24]|nr:hypothetical protein [Bacillus sp. LEw-kw-24]MDH6557486.1 hypothetical protein [Bacillus sp. LEw-kw-2]MDH8704000.1 hypothetical protein [Stenotrophomonas sp. 1198]
MMLGREFCFTLLSINLSNTRSTEYSFEILLVFRLWGCRFFTISFSVKYVKDIKKTPSFSFRVKGGVSIKT